VKDFLKTVNYSSSNEDSLSEIRALRIRDTDTVLCITGGGARPLDLLSESPGKIVSIDMNPCQNHLLELKIAAIRALPYTELLEFLGVYAACNRLETYGWIRGSLTGPAREFWDSHPSAVRRGVLYQGRWEQYFRKLAWCVGCMRPRLRDRLFRCTGVPDQARLWNDEWNDAVWRGFLRILSLRPVWRIAFGDPGFYLHVPGSFSIHAYLTERFTGAFSRVLASDSPFARLLFFGRYEAERGLPLYLRRERIDAIRANLPRVDIVTGSLSDYLGSCPDNRIDKFSLSDFSSYTDVSEYDAVWKGIVRCAKPEAVACERQFLVKREPPAGVRPFIVRDERLERELSESDNSIFYTFVVASIQGNGHGILAHR
jgi:S-adenosylmethionine-diacylglycerol 3-amino-3-carboxypropyl transferase